MIEIPTEMNAAFLTGVSRLEVRRVAVPRVGPGEVLVRVRAVGLCGSDIRIFENGSPRIAYPAIPGHEISGDIVRVGSGAGGWRPEQRVAVGSLIPCGRCAACRAGDAQLCETSEMIGYQRSGGMAEFVLLPKRLLTHGFAARIPGALSYDTASLAEPLSTMLNAIERMGGVRGRSLAVFGSGGAAGLAVAASHILGAKQIVRLGRSVGRKNAAAATPTMHVRYAGPDAAQRTLFRATKGRGFDRVVVASDKAEMQTLAVSVTAVRGSAVLFGVVSNGEMVAMNTNDIHYRESTVVGSFGAAARHFQAAVRMLAKHPQEFAPLVTHRFPLSDVAGAYGAMTSARRTKIVVHPSGEKRAI
ncbi:MAG: alcohol dehydrogenase catalytic domain-containing protein [Gemmatimonadaceae bacterium]